MAAFTPTQLYGGTLTAELPAGFGDVSDIRQVPDNQEVYLDANGFASIVFDITERLDPSQASNDEEALKFHFHDIAGDTNDATSFWQSGSAKFTKMPNFPAYTLIATQHPNTAARGPQPDFIGILLILLRLEQKKTDIVITINVPHVPGEYPKDEVDFAAAKQGPLMEHAITIRQKILETFEVKDWSLFVDEE
ncbi:uncharacterized protein K452DRAFT_285917 [Aplosporella prunicola CBS 121167]|uniref:Ran-interacting Mog1 protein n=1 Tax=Aplosporella prunicola CBS 121167 TaxID=1176127 RepID=A0A6A6BJS5_9PEZI|nr:uncharacterized protein K452DRAFT_285917 [Aplosporella prunicola CBS 121167]KAF2143878.1 hypothetical protein K452DRAFT_285917 [Aplosporella prunicola CBS 121167]